MAEREAKKKEKAKKITEKQSTIKGNNSPEEFGMPSSFVRTRKLPGESSRSVKTYPKRKRMIETSTKSNEDVFPVLRRNL